MIFSAYPTMGKTTLTKKRLDIIDLESSCFDKSNPYWYIDYCKTALDLEKQGYIVFVSSHASVQEYMKSIAQNYVMIMYDKSLRDYVIKKCEDRYNLSKSEKDGNALGRVKKFFIKDFQAIYDDDDLNKYFVKDETYNLEAIVDQITKEMERLGA